MSIELKHAAEKALVVLGSATSFMSRKARDQHESVVAELRTAIQQAGAQQPATGEPVGYQEIFNAIAAATEVQAGAVAVSVKAFTQAIGKIYTHPAPSVPDEVVHLRNAPDPIAPATTEPVANDGWLQDRGLLYRLTDEKNPQNRDEIKVMMADSSRSDASCTRRAGELLDRIRATHPAPSVPDGYALAPMEPNAAMLEAGYNAGPCWDVRHVLRIYLAMLAASDA